MTVQQVTVVLIDDDSTDNYIHSRVIGKSGLGTISETFQEPERALQWLREAPRQIDIILLDINMPRMNGFEFLQAYQQLPPAHQAGTVVVMLTSSDSQQDRDRAAALGAGFVAKPLTVEAFAHLVSQHSSE